MQGGLEGQSRERTISFGQSSPLYDYTAPLFIIPPPTPTTTVPISYLEHMVTHRGGGALARTPTEAINTPGPRLRPPILPPPLVYPLPPWEHRKSSHVAWILEQEEH